MLAGRDPLKAVHTNSTSSAASVVFFLVEIYATALYPASACSSEFHLLHLGAFQGTLRQRQCVYYVQSSSLTSAYSHEYL